MTDKQILRELATRVAEIAALPIQAEKREMWKRLNALQPVRPMVLIDEIPWHEMDVDGFLETQCADPFLQDIETQLRRTLYRWEHLPCDMVVEPYVTIPRAIENSGFGMATEQDVSVKDQGNAIVGHRYKPQLVEDEDIEKIVVPVLTEDAAQSAEREKTALEALDGLLGVRMSGLYIYCNLWDTLVEWMGPENVLMDVIDRPEFLEKAMDHFCTVYLEMIEQAEAKNLLDDGVTNAHCSYAYTYETDFPRHKTGEKVSAMNVWTDGTAQLFGYISEKDHEMLEFKHIKRVFEKFGRVYYGCCEPLHNRMHLVRQLPNVRKVSCSPWADMDIAAEQIHGEYIAVNKPNPAWLAQEIFDADVIVKDLERSRDACARHGTNLEYILKDISTVQYKPQRIWEWAALAMKVVLEK